MKVLPVKMTEADKTVIVDMHNKLRRQVAKGTELRGRQPAAANMREMVRNRFFFFLLNSYTHQFFLLIQTNYTELG